MLLISLQICFIVKICIAFFIVCKSDGRVSTIINGDRTQFFASCRVKQLDTQYYMCLVGRPKGDFT